MMELQIQYTHTSDTDTGYICATNQCKYTGEEKGREKCRSLHRWYGRLQIDLAWRPAHLAAAHDMDVDVVD